MISQSKKTNPIQTQSNPIAERIKLMQSLYLQRIMKKNAAKGYEKTKPKTNPISSKAKMNTNVFITKEYENETTLRLRKNKPNQTQFQRQKNAPAPLRNRCVAQEIFEKLLICTCLLFDNSIVLRTIH